MTTTTKQSAIMRAARGAALTAALWLPLAGCSTDAILDVEDPDIINPDAVNSPAGATALFAGAVGEFSLAIVGNAGGTEGQILVGGLMSDEFVHSGTFPTRLEYELRSPTERNGTLEGVFRNLQRARVLLEASVPALQTFAPTPPSRIGEAFTLAGMTYIWAGEHYCSGVPFSNAFPAVSYGSPLTTDQMFTTAVERFDSALTYLAAPDPRFYLAQVGKGRALLNLGNYAAAAAAVAAVPPNAVYQTTHTITSSRQQNGVHVFNWLSERWSVADAEGANGLNFRLAVDPRVKSVRSPANNLGFDNSTAQFNLLKYPDRTTPLPIATGIEAKLIIAEALLAGDPVAWLDTLNFLRASLRSLPGFLGPADTLPTDSLPPLVDPGSATTRQDLMFRERAFWLYATGHRLGDLRRLMRQYGRAEDAVFPTGIHFKGTAYGDDVNLPVPFDERNNPNFDGCIDRNP